MQTKECVSFKLVFTLNSPVTPSLLMAVHKTLMSTSVKYGRLLMLWKSGLVVNNVTQDIIFEVNLESMFVSIQGNSGPMVLHYCLALATCIRSKSN